MADRGLIHYQPVTGPVWTESVASRLAWLPHGEPAVRLERRVPSEFAWSPFYSLYDPADLHWLPSGRWPIIPEIRKLGDFQQPPFDALYKPEQLGWLNPAYYAGRLPPRGSGDLTVLPTQFAAPVFDPQNLEWIPSGRYSIRGIQYAVQTSWVVDPSPIAAVAFDPQFFPFQATDILLARTLPQTIQSDCSSPPLPPGPDVIPPAGSAQPGWWETVSADAVPLQQTAQRQLVISKKYLESILGAQADEEEFLESIIEQISQAEQPSQPEISREIGLLSALDAITHAYNVHFETLGAARSAIQARQVELDEEDMIMVLMILAMAEET